jgi:carboxymethylenebutenolidase
MWWSAFAIQVQLKGGTRHWIGDDLFVSETSYAGTHVGEFLGMAPTRRPIQFRFVVFVTFRDGLFAGERFYYDLATVLRQMGVERL